MHMHCTMMAVVHHHGHGRWSLYRLALGRQGITSMSTGTSHWGVGGVGDNGQNKAVPRSTNLWQSARVLLFKDVYINPRGMQLIEFIGRMNPEHQGRHILMHAIRQPT